jgi:hypothetical protein
MNDNPTYPASFTCSICKEKIVGEHSHNPFPYAGKHCCTRCNREQVIPARMALIYMKKVTPDKGKPDAAGSK